jgi:hypothetical protein
MWVSIAGPGLVACGGLIAIFGSSFPRWQPVFEFLGLVMGSLGGALVSIMVGQIWWSSVTRDETQRNLAHAISRMFTQDPETVAAYFKPAEILGFVDKNIEARTGDSQLAHAITMDLIRPFVDGRSAITRVRTSQRYVVNLRHSADGDGHAVPGRLTMWRVVENLSFDERLPIAIGTDSVLAAFVFCETALNQWFAKDDCMYRTVVYMPEHVAAGSPPERARWAAENLACSIRIGGRDLALVRSDELQSDDPALWGVTFRLAADDAARIDEMCAAASERSGEQDEVAALTVAIQSRTTYSPSRHSYTAYLAYPTLNPVIEFQIDGPVDQVECASFYSRATPLPGSSSADDVELTRLDGAEEPRHLRVALAQPRWVFPMSGASFSWTLRDPDRTDT